MVVDISSPEIALFDGSKARKAIFYLLTRESCGGDGVTDQNGTLLNVFSNHKDQIENTIT